MQILVCWEVLKGAKIYIFKHVHSPLFQGPFHLVGQTDLTNILKARKMAKLNGDHPKLAVSVKTISFSLPHRKQRHLSHVLQTFKMFSFFTFRHFSTNFITSP
jgi:hypothetical protein